jgi:5-methyltetrahydropteroyltriglutamate--homocysteine methyltransferase
VFGDTPLCLRLQLLLRLQLVHLPEELLEQLAPFRAARSTSPHWPSYTSRQVKMTVPGPFTMSQQVQNDFYPSPAEAAMDYAVAVNEEIRDLFAAGADIVQVDEPYMQARPQKAEDYGLAALNRALDGVTGTTAVHICFGYAAIIHERPSGYSFLTQFKNCSCRQVSIETAQSKLDCSVLSELRGKKVLLGVIDLSDMNVETPEIVAFASDGRFPMCRAKTSSSPPTAG